MPKVLLIENDTSSAESISTCLSAQGADLITSGDGAEGVQLVRDGQFDLIILSVELPRVSGYSVCNKLKKDPTLASIPLILISSDATVETFSQHKKLKTRAEGYLHKPIDQGELLAEVSSHISLTDLVEEDVSMETVVMEFDGLEIDMDSTGSTEVSLDDDIAALDLPVLPDDDDDFLDEDVLGSLEVLDAMENGDMVGDDELVVSSIIEDDEDNEDDEVEIDLSSDESFESEELLIEDSVADSESAASGVSAILNSSTSYVSDGLLDTMRSEISELRHKVRGLEETLEAKELEFSERLLEESTRARQAIGDRQKVSQMEHDLEKAHAAMSGAEDKAKENTSQIKSLEERLQASKAGLDEFSSTIERLEKELKASQSSQDDAKNRVSDLEGKVGKLSQELSEGNEQRHKAREIISSMMQMLDDINHHPNSAD